MVGKELVLSKDGAVDLREVAAKTTLREVRQKGHPYVELRRVGKRTIFFCTICLTECFSDNVLFDHLKGSSHSRRLTTAKVTLFGPMPWPFNDGILFFNNSREEEPMVLESGSTNTQEKTLLSPMRENEVTSRLSSSLNSANGNGAVYADLRVAVKGPKAPSRRNGASKEIVVSAHNEAAGPLVVPGVLLKDGGVGDLPVHLLGFGGLGYKACEGKEGRLKFNKIWCAWVGQDTSCSLYNRDVCLPCDFAIVNFSYSYELGRPWDSDEDQPTSPGSYFVTNEAGHRGKKRKKSFSDHEVSSDESNAHSSSHNGDGPDATSHSASSSRQLQVSLVTSKSARRDLKKHKRLAAERACDICGQAMLPGKDVATLMNCRTGNLACSSRNSSGSFHVFHASCLTHWVLLCEHELLAAQTASNKKPTRGRKPKAKAAAAAAAKTQMSSILCPECQGTGIHIEGDDLEKPSISLAEMFRYKLKAIEAHNAWLKNPEALECCSTGLHFPSESVEDYEEKVAPLKLLQFYGADE